MEQIFRAVRSIFQEEDFELSLSGRGRFFGDGSKNKRGHGTDGDVEGCRIVCRGIAGARIYARAWRARTGRRRAHPHGTQTRQSISGYTGCAPRPSRPSVNQYTIGHQPHLSGVASSPSIAPFLRRDATSGPLHPSTAS